jgi:O-antigen biosynthesis protein
MDEEVLLVSIVVPCYNSRMTIGECLASLEGQSYPREQYEIIVADNGSTDGGLEWISAHYPLVRIVNAQLKGSGYARNAGIEAARGEIVLSTDSDCVANKDWIAALVTAFCTAPTATAAIGGVIVPYSQRTAVERYPEAWVTQPQHKLDGPQIRYTATPNAAFKRSALVAVGGFDGSLGFDDTDLGVRLIASGYSVSYTDKAIVMHRNPATWRQLYRHRKKYGEFNYTLARAHPDVFGDPRGKLKRRDLLLETGVRIAKDLIKFPLSMLLPSHERPAGWPLIDAVIAWGNCRGFIRASRQADLIRTSVLEELHDDR